MTQENIGNKKTIVIISGGFDPLHIGHIDYIREAKKLGDYLIVGLNSDDWLGRKKGKAFMSWEDRKYMIEAVIGVDKVVRFDDSDDSACCLIKDVCTISDSGDSIIFANGGDRDMHTTPEATNFAVTDIQFKYGVGGKKTQSSSELLSKWTENKTKRLWGEYEVLFKDDRVKVKELVIESHKGISYQKHFLRSEIWFVSQGKCTVKHSTGKPTNYTMHNLREDDVFTVRANEWHQIYNPYDKACHVIEIQYGSEMDEEDILRDEEVEDVLLLRQKLMYKY